MKHALHWFEIPTTDLARATKFYEQVLAASFRTEDFQGTQMTVLKFDGLGGALVASPRHTPSADGALVYLNSNGPLEAALDRVPAAGGRVLGPVVNLGPQGRFAVIADTEGNRVALHQPS